MPSYFLSLNAWINTMNSLRNTHVQRLPSTVNISGEPMAGLWVKILLAKREEEYIGSIL